MGHDAKFSIGNFHETILRTIWSADRSLYHSAHCFCDTATHAGFVLHHKTELCSTHSVCVCLEHWLWCSWDVPVQHIVISVPSQDLSQMLSPFPKIKRCTDREMKPPTHTSELGSMQTGRQSCLLRHCGYSKLGPYLLGTKGSEGLCTGKQQWRPIRWLYRMEGVGCCRWLSHRGQFSPIGGSTLDWVMFSTERGGADLALLHTELSPPQAGM